MKKLKMENKKNEFEREAMDLEEMDQVNGGMGGMVIDCICVVGPLAVKGVESAIDWVKGLF